MIRTENYWAAPAQEAVAVTPDNSNNLAVQAKGLWVGGTGTVKVTLSGQKDSEAVTFAAVPAGTMLPVQVKKVFATGTSATLILALY